MYPVNTELGIIPGYNRSYIKIELLKENYLVEGGPQEWFTVKWQILGLENIKI